MNDCENYQECLNDPYREKEMEELCRECLDLSGQLLENPDVSGKAAPGPVRDSAPDALLGGYPVFIDDKGAIEIVSMAGSIHATRDDLENLLQLIKEK